MVHTLLEAIVLVVLVVILFLQTWRASIIPLLAVPVSVIGTFAVLHLLGFSINALSLFGLVLAIGIVVDDAIVVVENVERNIEAGLTPRNATYRAMREVSGPIIAIALVLVAVFVPLAFISGLTGQFYKQFAVTIAISTVISAINSLTLSPALAALLLRGHDAPKDALTRGMDRAFGWLFRGFNRMFHRGSEAYSGGVGRVISRKALMLAIYLALIAVTFGLFKAVPSGFVPAQDKQYLIGFAQLPDGATLDRTDEVIRRMGEIMKDNPNVEDTIAFPGLSINGFTNSSNSGIVFATLKPFDERKRADQSGGAVAGQLNQAFAGIQDAFIVMFPPPPVAGLGTTGGFKLQLEDRASLGYDQMDAAVKAFMAKAYQTPELTGMFTSWQVNVPQLYADIDRTKARQLGVPVTDIFDTMQIYLGSLYANDFNKFGRTYSVRVQADAPYRARAEDVGMLKVRSSSGEMIPLSALMKVDSSFSRARHALQRLPHGRHQRRCRTGLLFGPGAGRHQAHRGRDPAQGHRLRMDRPDLSGNPGRQFGGDRVPAGPAAGLPGAGRAVREPDPADCHHPDRAHGPVGGHDRRLAVGRRQQCLHADRAHRAGGAECEERHPDRGVRAGAGVRGPHAHTGRHRGQPAAPRPILMTSLAFVMGVLPLVLSTGAGSEMRRAMGVAVFSGMIGVTAFGLFLTPVFYVLMRRLAGNRPLKQHGPEMGQ